MKHNKYKAPKTVIWESGTTNILDILDHTIRYDTTEEFNVDSKAEYTA